MGRKVSLFGKDVLLKTQNCNQGPTPGQAFPPMVMLYAKVTNGCNAHCPFCSNNEHRAETTAFDSDKFFRIVDEILHHDELLLGSIRFTGGEPSMVTDRVVEPLLARFSEEPYRRLYLHLNTNARSPAAHRLMMHPRWNSISVSLHHYDRQRLGEIYGANMPEFSLQPFRRQGLKTNISCNLIRGYIDSADEAHRMMDYALRIGADTLGFVSLMKVNDYCRQHYVDYKDIAWDTIPSLYFSHRMDRGPICRCADYLYNSGGRALQVYMRNNLDPLYCESTLLYDGKHLRQGFYGEVIV